MAGLSAGDDGDLWSVCLNPSRLLLHVAVLVDHIRHVDTSAWDGHLDAGRPATTGEGRAGYETGGTCSHHAERER